MKRKNISMIASIIATALLTVLVIAAVIFLPQIMQVYSKMRDGIDVTGLMIALYVSALPGLLCSVLLMKLLFNIRAGAIFVKKNVTILQILSYCCMFVGVEYIAICYRRYIAMIFVGFAALFIGLILRVIKNVFDKAIEIREENDYTI